MTYKNIIKFSQLEEDYFNGVRIFLPPVDCGKIDVLDMSDFDFEKHENIKLLFTCKKRINDKFLEEYDLDPDIKCTGEVTYIYERHAIIIGGLGSIKNIIFPNDRHIRIYDMEYMFNGLNIREIDLSSFDTSCCRDMSSAFSGCKNLKSIDISKLDTSNCFRADGMFAGCTQLENIKFGSKYLWNSINDMFRGCTNLKKISCSSIDMPDLDRAIRMFQDCENLETVDFSNAFIESCLFICTFKDCKNLKSVNFSETKLSPQGAYLACAFDGCRSLETIDFSSCEFDDKTLLSLNGLHSLRRIIMKGCNDFSIQYVKNKILEAKDAGDGPEFNVEVVY